MVLFDPNRIPVPGLLNDISPVYDRSNLLSSQLDGNKIQDMLIEKATSPNVIKKHLGEFNGIIFKVKGETNIVSANDTSIDLSAVQGIKIEELQAYRVYIPEIHSCLKAPDDFYECSPEIGLSYPKVPFVTSTTLTTGDIVKVTFLDKEKCRIPKGGEKISTKPLDLKNPASFTKEQEKKQQLSMQATDGQSPKPKTPIKSGEDGDVTTANRDLNSLNPDFRKVLEKVIAAAKTEDIPVILNETYRSQARQDFLYAKGRTKNDKGEWELIDCGCCVVTKTLSSNHTSRKAADFRLNTDPNHPYWKKINALPTGAFDAKTKQGKGAFEVFGALAKRFGLRWGGDFSGFYDPGHVEATSTMKFDG